MRALLFAAGLGSRLRPLTDTMPKALVPVLGQPLLYHVLQRLECAGTTEVVVNVHHFGEQIINYLEHHHWAMDIRISDEREHLLDTGGGLRRAFSIFSPSDAPILLHNVDILSNANLPALVDEHQNHKADVTLLVSERTTQRYLLFDDNMRLMGWTNLTTGEVRSPYPNLDPTRYQRFAFSGIHCVAPTLSAWMQNSPESFPIMPFYLNLCHRLIIRGVVQPQLRLLDVGKPDSLASANIFIANS